MTGEEIKNKINFNNQKIQSLMDPSVFILQPDHLPFPTILMDELMIMGITVDYTVTSISDDRWPITDIRKIGKYKVLTNSVRFVTAGQLALKRAMDIAGGIVGCILTGIIFMRLTARRPVHSW